MKSQTRTNQLNIFDMKKNILLFSLTLISTFTFGQSVTISPNGDTRSEGHTPEITLRATNIPELRGISSQGSITSPMAVANNRSLLQLNGQGYTGAGFTNDRVQIRLATSEAWSAAANGTWIQFSTTENGTISMTERMRITNEGRLAIGLNVPEGKVEILHSYPGTASVDAHLNLKSLSNYSGINFTNSSNTNKMTILGRTNTAVLASNYLLFNTPSGNAMIIRGDNEVQHYGYTKLGNIAPAIKMKKLTGTTDADATTSFAHGLDFDKIISYDIIIKKSTGKYQPSNSWPNSSYHYSGKILGDDVSLTAVGTALQGEAYIVLITYEE